jgi:hypothetical protein
MKVAMAGMLLISGLALSAPLFAGQAPGGVDAYFAAHPDLALCASYKTATSESLRAELVGRKLLTDKDLKLLERHRGDTGLSECGLLAAEGRPVMISEHGDGRFESLHPGFPMPETYDVLYVLAGAPDDTTVWAVVAHGVVTSVEAARR